MDQDLHCLAQPSLYHLHAAYLALLSAPSTSKNRYPLPVWGSIQARSFLAELAQQDDSSNTQPKSRVAVPSASALDKGLNSLPTHWIQHNPLCAQCGSVCIPGISSTMPRKSKGKQRATCKTFACMACSNTLAEGSKNNRMSTVDRAAKDASKARFPSVRQRKKSFSRKGRIDENQEEKAFASSIAADPDESKPPSSIATNPKKPPAVPASNLVGPDSSRPLKRKLSEVGTTQMPDSQLPPSASKIPQQEVDRLSKKVTTEATHLPAPAPASQSASVTKNKPHSTSTAKQDHKAALRSLLMKDARKKGSEAGKKDADKQKSSASGGGLRDFLADL